jgi:hypothetical protein
MSELKKCPFCGGEAVLVEMYESCDGRCDRFPRVKCTDCQAEVGLTFKEFTDATHEYGYTGGYYSQNKKVWDGIHQKVVDKWNNRKPVEYVIKFETTEEMARDLADKALDEYMYEGKTVRQWAEVLADYDDKQTTLKWIVKRLEEELNSADAEKERCARENPLQFDSVKGYATGIYNAIEITKEKLM